MTKELICRLFGIEKPQRRQAIPPSGITSEKCFKCDYKKIDCHKVGGTCSHICREYKAPKTCIDCIVDKE